MANTPKIDFLDVKILDTLQKNARITKTSLSGQVGLSATPCHERIKKLEDQGLITGYHADIDYTVFGNYSFYWVQISLLETPPHETKEFEEHLMAVPEVLECISVLGTVDYLVKIAAKTIQSYQEIIDDLLDLDWLNFDYKSMPMVRQVKKPTQSSLIQDQETFYRQKKK